MTFLLLIFQQYTCHKHKKLHTYWWYLNSWDNWMNRKLFKLHTIRGKRVQNPISNEMDVNGRALLIFIISFIIVFVYYHVNCSKCTNKIILEKERKKKTIRAVDKQNNTGRTFNNKIHNKERKNGINGDLRVPENKLNIISPVCVQKRSAKGCASAIKWPNRFGYLLLQSNHIYHQSSV